MGTVHEKRGGNVRVQCLKHPFSIKELQLLEHEQDAVFHEHVYHTNVAPKLEQFERALQFVY